MLSSSITTGPSSMSASTGGSGAISRHVCCILFPGRAVAVVVVPQSALFVQWQESFGYAAPQRHERPAYERRFVTFAVDVFGLLDLDQLVMIPMVARMDGIDTACFFNVVNR
jgi:hypothetical protein